MLKIRKATKKDRAAAEEFFSRMDPETKLYFNKTGKSYRRVMSFINGEPSDNIVFVAEYNGTLAGILVIMDRDCTTVWISLCVDKAFRKKGIGALLLERADKFVLQNGGGGILLSVNINNTPAISLYEKKNYIRLGENSGEYVYIKSYYVK